MTIEESRNAFFKEVQEVSQKHLNKLKDEMVKQYDDLTGTRLAQVNFENATLENIDFTEAHEVVGINLTNTTLINVILPDDLEVA